VTYVKALEGTDRAVFSMKRTELADIGVIESASEPQLVGYSTCFKINSKEHMVIMLLRD
jgi:hypothetical protein